MQGFLMPRSFIMNVIIDAKDYIIIYDVANQVIEFLRIHHFQDVCFF